MKIVLQDWKYGRIMRYTQDAYIGESIGLYGEYSHDEMELLRRVLKTGDTVIEVGANIGSLTIPIAQYIGNSGRIYAFEPQRITFQVLCGNIALNNLYNVWAYNKGVGKKNKKEKIFEGLYSGNNGAFAIADNHGQYEIEIVALDDLNFEKCDLLKIDAEGMDAEIIQGATELIKRYQPYISMEANYTRAGKEIVKKLRQLDYEVYEADCSLFSSNNDFQISRNIFLQNSGTKKYTDGEKFDVPVLANTVSFNWFCVPDSKGIKAQGTIVDETKWKD